ncbi:hypothetical protein ACOZ4L_06820 [Haloplanus ruber]|uniref:Glycerophosphoryl diester phosphodiesterase membrane domain-containing protein n=1 Tax=Haloplanus ruber TaxID=869892 RepID=A0ABD6CVP3_9EURY|nr:hypothetical protein [Haloplanus ruber]
MTLQDSSAERDGAGARAAAVVVALLVVDAAWNLSLNTLLVRSGAAETLGTTFAVTLPLTTLGAVGGLALASVAGLVLLAALARVFADGTGALGGGETLVETLAAYARAVVVGVVGVVAAGVGLAALVVPGLVVLVHLPLVFVAVAVDGDPIAQAVDRTWTRAGGNRARITAISLAVVAVPLALAVVATLTAMLSPVVEFALGVVVTGAAAAAGVAAFTRIAASLNGSGTGSTRTDRVNPAASGRL